MSGPPGPRDENPYYKGQSGRYKPGDHGKDSFEQAYGDMSEKKRKKLEKKLKKRRKKK